MKEKYIPVYSEGEIIVKFKDGLGEEFAKDFARQLGYENLEKNFVIGYTIKTKKGEEGKAIKKFIGYSEFVEFVERRDIKYEKRLELSQTLQEEVREIEDMCCEVADKKFKKNLEKLIKKIKNYHDPD